MTQMWGRTNGYHTNGEKQTTIVLSAQDALRVARGLRTEDPFAVRPVKPEPPKRPVVPPMPTTVSPALSREMIDAVIEEATDECAAAVHQSTWDSLRLVDELAEDIITPLVRTDYPKRVAVKDIVGYEWFRESRYKQAKTWFVGAYAAHCLRNVPANFFIDALVNSMNFDRAECACKMNANLKARGRVPIRRDEILQFIKKDGLNYELRETPFASTLDTPDYAVTDIAEFLCESAPDKVWIAKYVEVKPTRRLYDPIIYADFGAWSVEVARWD